MNHSEFSQLFNAIKGITLVSKDRLQRIYNLAKSRKSHEGSIAELGVYKGGVTMMLARALPHKRVYAFDTFEGIPNAQGDDVHANGDFSDVGSALDMLAGEPNVIVRKGMFPEMAISVTDSFCFAHFDGDTYLSCRDFIAYFRPRMTVGCIMVFDDYRWHKCPGVERALKEAFSADSIIETAEYQCAVFGPFSA